MNTFHIFSHYFLVNTLYIQQSCKLNENNYKIEGINNFKDLHVISFMSLTDSYKLARKTSTRQATGQVSTHSAFLTRIWYVEKTTLHSSGGILAFLFGHSTMEVSINRNEYQKNQRFLKFKKFSHWYKSKFASLKSKRSVRIWTVKHLHPVR